MNKMKEVAELLGVEIDEWFGIRESHDMLTVYECAITLDGVIVKDDLQSIGDYILHELLIGRYEIERNPFKPKYGDYYYSVAFDDFGKYVFKDRWRDAFTDYIQYNMGNCFKTKEEITDKVMERMIKKIKEKYENE